eukprot:GFUD01013146.1.p1 GENE.GFUD01013146.1~~GFUD01013146.1.p1  ORF type:complete len:295 (+),score=100.93 GFUD01013146.1:112-996(+)
MSPIKSGTSPAHKWLYIVLSMLGVMIAMYLGDMDTFTRVAVTSVFNITNEVYDDDKSVLAAGERVLTMDQLAKYDGSEGSPGLYLAMLGVVYDVSREKEYYSLGGGYNFFAGKDASRAFVTGQFDEFGLVDDLSGLHSADYIELEEWANFYEMDHVRVGVVEGAFYNKKAEVTQHWKDLQSWIEEAKDERGKHDMEKQMFPPCNVEWTRAEGSRFWCTARSGGVGRDWVGVPRQLFYQARQPRCACVRDRGPPYTNPGAVSDTGDLDSPHVKEYQGCHSRARECKVKEEEELGR